MSAPSTHSPVRLRTPRLILREFAEGDAGAIQVYAGDSEVTRFTSFGPNTPEVADSVLTNWIGEQKISPQTEWPLASVRQENELQIGATGLGAVDWSTGAGILSYVFRQSAWGQGYATETSRAVVDWAMNDLSVRRLVAHCEPANVASSSVLTKLGFWQEDPVTQPRLNGEMRYYLTFVKERR